MVRAGEAGEKLVDLCQSVGITPEAYYAWKARYSGLTASQVHDLRRRARVRKHRVIGLACALGVTAVGASALMATRSSDTPAAVHVMAEPAAVTAAPPAPQAPVDPPEVPSGASPDATASQAPAVTEPVVASARLTTSAPQPTVDDQRPETNVQGPTSSDYFVAEGYSVQVAAVPDLEQARTALEKLGGAGYPAHLTTKLVNGVEMYRIRVGPFDTRDAATHAAARLSHDGYESPWITR